MAECCPTAHVVTEDQVAPFAKIFAALSDVTRLQLALFVYHCCPAPVCACSMPEVFSVSRSTLSHHLTKLVEGGVLNREKKGKWSYYTISPLVDTTILDYLSHAIAQSTPQDATTISSESPSPHREKKPVTVLFTCTQNAGRSQMAAAIAQSLAPEGVTIISAGTDPAEHVHSLTRVALAEIGLTPDTTPQQLDTEMVRDADWVVTMGCGEECPIFPGKHYEDWRVADPQSQPIDVIRTIRNDINERVIDLLKRLNHDGRP